MCYFLHYYFVFQTIRCIFIPSKKPKGYYLSHINFNKMLAVSHINHRVETPIIPLFGYQTELTLSKSDKEEFKAQLKDEGKTRLLQFKKMFQALSQKTLAMDIATALSQLERAMNTEINALNDEDLNENFVRFCDVGF